MTKTINWGILGCGWIANKFATSAAVLENDRVVAAASHTPDKAKAFAAKHSIQNYYDDYAELLKNDEVDAVYIATTHNFHCQNVKQVLEANKPVLCEKPFTVNARELKSLISMAKSKELFMMEAMWTRFLPAFEQIRIWLAEEVIGKIKQIRASLGYHYPFDPNHRLYNLDLAGGALLDVGVYPLAFANMVMKQNPAEIKALGEIGQAGSDEQSSYLLKYDSGCLAYLDAAVSVPLVSGAEIIGAKGRIFVPDHFFKTREVWLERQGQEPVQRKFPFEDDARFSFEIKAASDSIRKGLLENEIMPLNDSLQIMETIDEIKSQLGLIYANDKQ